MYPQDTHINIYVHLFADTIKGLKAILGDMDGRPEACPFFPDLTLQNVHPFLIIVTIEIHVEIYHWSDNKNIKNFFHSSTVIESSLSLI